MPSIGPFVHPHSLCVSSKLQQTTDLKLHRLHVPTAQASAEGTNWREMAPAYGYRSHQSTQSDCHSFLWLSAASSAQMGFEHVRNIIWYMNASLIVRDIGNPLRPMGDRKALWLWLTLTATSPSVLFVFFLNRVFPNWTCSSFLRRTVCNSMESKWISGEW